MFDNVSIRKQLYLGFSVIIVLLFLSTGLVIEVMSNTYSSFDRYRDMARDANLMGRVQANLLLARTQAKDYFVSNDHEDMLGFQHYYQRMRSFVDEAQTEITQPERARTVDFIDDETKLYSNTFTDLVQYTEQRNTLIDKTLSKGYRRIHSQFTMLLNKIHNGVEDESIDENVTAMFISFMGLKTSLIKFITLGNQLDFDNAIVQYNHIYDIHYSNEELFEKSVFSTDINKLVSELNVYEDALYSIRNLTIKRNNTIDLLNKLGPEISQIAEDVKLEIKSVQDTLGPLMVMNNQTTFSYILGLAIFEILITLLIAIHIPRVIIRSLEQLKRGVLSFLSFLRTEKKEPEPILITCDNEFSQISSILNDNIFTAAEVLNKKRQIEEKQNETLREMAITDGLTGLYNRRYFDELALTSFNTSKRFNHHLIFFILDIDYFKNFNDNYGHVAGDAALQAVATSIKNHLKRSDDLVFRLGGEEFGGFGISEKEGLADDLEYIKDICTVVESLKISHNHSKASNYITVSMGIRIVNPAEEQLLTLKQAYADADFALYQAKQSGRNQVIVFDKNKHQS